MRKVKFSERFLEFASEASLTYDDDGCIENYCQRLKEQHQDSDLFELISCKGNSVVVNSDTGESFPILSKYIEGA